MRKLLSLVLLVLVFASLPVSVFAEEQALKFPMREGSNAGAHRHNEEGIKRFNRGDFNVALKHFQIASRADPTVGESHYNESLCHDKLGRHQEATSEFYSAIKYAHENSAILSSRILNAHVLMKREGS